MRFEIAANRWQFESLRTANRDLRLRIGPALHRVSEALRARNPGRVRKESPEVTLRTPKGYAPESQTSPKKSNTGHLDSLRTHLRLRDAIFRDSGAPLPGLFQDSFWTLPGSGPEGPGDPVRGGAAPNLRHLSIFVGQGKLEGLFK